MGKASPRGARLPIICRQCGETKYVIPSVSKITKFCSKRCSDKFKSENWRGKNCIFFKGLLKDVNCYECGKTIKRYEKYINKHTKLFCGHGCYAKHKRGLWTQQGNPKYNGGVPELICAGCGITFKKYIAREYDNRYCTQECYFRHTHKSSTTIENLIEQALTENNIQFNKQVKIGKMIVDFLAFNNIVIQCDGDYWHNLPGVIKKDEKHNQQLTQMGFQVYRFWEKDIRKNPQNCIDQIQKNGMGTPV